MRKKMQAEKATVSKKILTLSFSFSVKGQIPRFYNYYSLMLGVAVQMKAIGQNISCLLCYKV